MTDLNRTEIIKLFVNGQAVGADQDVVISDFPLINNNNRLLDQRDHVQFRIKSTGNNIPVGSTIKINYYATGNLGFVGTETITLPEITKDLVPIADYSFNSNYTTIADYFTLEITLKKGTAYKAYIDCIVKKKIDEDSLTVKTNQPIPTASTVGKVGDIVVDTNGNKYTLIRIDGGVYYWSPPRLRRISLHMNAGLFDFSAFNLINRKWYFPDGSTSTDLEATRTLSAAGTVDLEGDWESSYNVHINAGRTSQFKSSVKNLGSVYYQSLTLNGTQAIGTFAEIPRVSHTIDLGGCSQLTGNISDMPSVSNTINVYGCTQAVGDVAFLPRISYYLNLGNCSQLTGRMIDIPRVSYFLDIRGLTLITGTLADSPRVSHTFNISDCRLITGTLITAPRVLNSLNLYNLNLITGTLADLPITSSLLFLRSCSLLTGSLAITTIATYIDIAYTACTKAEVDQSLANLVAGHPSMSGAKTLVLTGLKRSAASSTNVAILTSRGWLISDAVIE